MSALDVFTYSGQQVRTVLIDGEPWFVLSDLCAVLDIANVVNVKNRIHPDGVRQADLIDSMGRNQTPTIVNESNMYEVVIRSDKPEAVVFRRWLTSVVLPAIRKTGSYSTAPAVDLASPEGILALAEKFTETARALVAVTARAEVAEDFKDAIELNDGITPREFHKKYLPSVTETEFSAALYRHRLLIDQTGQRGRNAKGKIINGKQHRHPTFQGKAFFYLHSELDRDKIRREHVRVIPGEPELLLVKWCSARGLIDKPLQLVS